MIHYGVPQIIDWIKLYENGTKVCTQLGICSVTTPALSANEVYVVPTLVTSNLQCEVCKTLVSTVEMWLSANTTMVQVELFLQGKICPFIASFEAVVLSVPKLFNLTVQLLDGGRHSHHRELADQERSSRDCLLPTGFLSIQTRFTGGEH